MEAVNLCQTVSTWSPCEISKIADSLSAESAQPIRTTFTGFEDYCNYFEPLLQAELAAELAASTDKFTRSPIARPGRIRARREDPGTLVVHVRVAKVAPIKNPCKIAVDLEPTDDKGPVGCGDGDVVAVWPTSSKVLSSTLIPKSAVCATALRPYGKHGVRITLDKLPNIYAPYGQELEEGEEPEVKEEDNRFWFLLRLGSITTLRREHDAVQHIKSSRLLQVLMKPKSEKQHAAGDKLVAAQPKTNGEVQPDGEPAPLSICDKLLKIFGLNDAQETAVREGSESKEGFTCIQGPPGTGKTKTLTCLLNVIHLSQYQAYYETLVFSIKRKCRKHTAPQSDTRVAGSAAGAPSSSVPNNFGLLDALMAGMNKTFGSMIEENLKLRGRTRRPRLLVCAPSNSAVDEILTRIMDMRFCDAEGLRYSPELVRIGGGDKVQESVKFLTAELQAETFLVETCKIDETKEIRRKFQLRYLSDFQEQANRELDGLRCIPKRESNCDIIVKVHEQLERAERNLRRLGIAANENLTREEKVRNVARTFVEDAQIVFSTLSGAASRIMMPRGMSSDKDDCLFDTVIIDEAAQATEPACLVPLMLGAKKCLLIGDPQQLPATVLSAGNAGAAYGQSLLDRVSRAGVKMLLLNVQYRMHPAISAFPRLHFYEGNLNDDASVKGENRFKPCHNDSFKPKLGPYVFLDLAFGEEKRDFDARSVNNPEEAKLAVNIYKKLQHDYPKDCIFSEQGRKRGSNLGIGVVTPYRSQLKVLRREFESAGVSSADVEIDTVDAYQGREKDVMIFSCVRTSVTRGIGFVRDVRRMNVGLTRARSSLIILGNAQALADGSNDWAALVEDARSRGCLMRVADVNQVFSLKPVEVKTENVPQPGGDKRDPRMRKPRQIPGGTNGAAAGQRENETLLRQTFESTQRQYGQGSIEGDGQKKQPNTETLDQMVTRALETLRRVANVEVSEGMLSIVRGEIERSGRVELEVLIALVATSASQNNSSQTGHASAQPAQGGYEPNSTTPPPPNAMPMMGAQPGQGFVPPPNAAAAYAAAMGMGYGQMQAQPPPPLTNAMMGQQPQMYQAQQQPYGAPMPGAPYPPMMMPHPPHPMDMHAAMGIAPPGMNPQFPMHMYPPPLHGGTAPGPGPAPTFVPMPMGGQGGMGYDGWGDGGGGWSGQDRNDSRDPRDQRNVRGGGGYNQRRPAPQPHARR